MDRFQVNLDQHTVTCPAGTTVATRAIDGRRARVRGLPHVAADFSAVNLATIRRRRGNSRPASTRSAPTA